MGLGRPSDLDVAGQLTRQLHQPVSLPLRAAVVPQQDTDTALVAAQSQLFDTLQKGFLIIEHGIQFVAQQVDSAVRLRGDFSANPAQLQHSLDGELRGG